jgi:hypothetical protein
LKNSQRETGLTIGWRLTVAFQFLNVTLNTEAASNKSLDRSHGKQVSHQALSG